MSNSYHSPNLSRKFSKKESEQTQATQHTEPHQTSISQYIPVKPWKDGLREEITDLYLALDKARFKNQFHSRDSHPITKELKRINFRSQAQIRSSRFIQSSKVGSNFLIENSLISQFSKELPTQESLSEKLGKHSYEQELREEELKYLRSVLIDRMEKHK